MTEYFNLLWAVSVDPFIRNPFVYDNMYSREIDDSRTCFIGTDREVAIVIHEEDGELLRISGRELTFEDVVEDDMP